MINEIVSNSIIVTDISNITIPNDTLYIDFELIGAGGHDPSTGQKTYTDNFINLYQ